MYNFKKIYIKIRQNFIFFNKNYRQFHSFLSIIMLSDEVCLRGGEVV